MYRNIEVNKISTFHYLNEIKSLRLLMQFLTYPQKK